MTNTITIELPIELKRKLEKSIENTDFQTIEEYILYFLNQMVEGSETETIYTKEEENKFNKNKPYDDEDEAALRKKLAEMGYL